MLVPTVAYGVPTMIVPPSLLALSENGPSGGVNLAVSVALTQPFAGFAKTYAEPPNDAFGAAAAMMFPLALAARDAPR
jgi:hypothetical protein